MTNHRIVLLLIIWFSVASGISNSSSILIYVKKWQLKYLTNNRGTWLTKPTERSIDLRRLTMCMRCACFVVNLFGRTGNLLLVQMNGWTNRHFATSIPFDRLFDIDFNQSFSEVRDEETCRLFQKLFQWNTLIHCCKEEDPTNAENTDPLAAFPRPLSARWNARGFCFLFPTQFFLFWPVKPRCSPLDSLRPLRTAVLPVLWPITRQERVFSSPPFSYFYSSCFYGVGVQQNGTSQNHRYYSPHLPQQELHVRVYCCMVHFDGASYP